MKQAQTIKFSTQSHSSIASHADDMNLASSGGNMSQTNSFAINSCEVLVEVDKTTHTSGSSAVATRNIINYPWELVYIPGNLVTVHSSGNFIAYAIQALNSMSSVVRIICRRTITRGLIKNIPGVIKDLSFAYLTSKILLAFTDHFGTFYVYEIYEENDTLGTKLLMEVKQDRENEMPCEYQRVIWCPFIPDDGADEEDDDDENEEDNLSYLIVVTNGPLAEIWHVATIVNTHGTGLIDRCDIQEGSGHQVMEKHSAPISDAAFSPDGTALATASLDGYVKFFQVNMSSSGESSPRCLRQWKPHDGKPLSCLFFFDNHKNPLPDVQFWKYAVTGACNNTEIKTWSCEDWLCNQQISFQTPPDSKLETSNLCMKAAIDPSSRYLILSDIYRRVLYVLIISQESAPFVESISNGDANESSLSHNSVKAGVARIVSISELPVQYPAMFLTITDAEWKPYKRWKHEHPAVSCLEDKDDDEDVDDDDTDNINIVEGLVVKCIFMNTKSLQDVSIRFQPVFPPSSYNATGVTSSNHRLSISDDSVVLKDGLTDMSINLSATLNELDTSKGKNLSENDGTSLDNLVAFTSSPSCSNVVSEDIVRSLSSSACLPVGVISSLPCALSDSTPIPSLSSPTVTNSVECVSSNQPVTMNLLTPESFSSPGRANEDQHHEKCDSMKPIEPVRDIFTKTSSPSEDLKRAALSLMLKVNSASLMPSSDVVSSVASLVSLSSQNIESSSVLDTVVAGSSKSPPVVSLPPAPRKGTSPLPDSEDAPLAASEVNRLTPSKKNEIDLTSSNDYVNGTSGAVVTSTTISQMSSGIALASSTSSPSLEVQQILHSHNSRKEDVAMARLLILSAVEHFSQIKADRKNNLNGPMAPGPPTNVPGQITISVRVPYEVVGLVVGPKGATIKRIQLQSDTYIVTPSRDKEPVFEVTGLPDSVEHARKEIESHIAMRTCGLLYAEETSNAVANAVSAVTYASVNGKQSEFGNGASSHSLDNLFSSSDLMSSLYKLNQSTFGSFNGGLSSLGGSSVGGSSLNALNSLNSTSTMNTFNNLGGTSSTLGSTLSSLPPLSDNNYLLGDSNSLLSSKTMENSLFPPLGTAGSAQSKLELNGALGSLYSVDEGLGYIGSSMESSPSFDPNPSSLWGDIGRNMASSLSSVSNSNGGSLSSNLSLTRRSSPASGQSPPSSRLSPTLELHPSARRISSDPSVNLAPGSFSSMLTSNNTSGSFASTPELALGSVQEISFLLGAAAPPTVEMEQVPLQWKKGVVHAIHPVAAALVPCGHNLFCMDCATRLKSESGKCTICLEEVSQAIRNFS
ncbi:UNVERIFIED_CONTAM: hypothetical protein RMT77_017803 [Armadillidium vulgare]